ncbi:AAA family ATPase [Stappia indica]|uniref:AAA family ATPase n=1 Tax=Stappia indica TaxID=538381 RepID=UPI001CD36306|nr:CtpF protein [Stappia indica]MCA1300792.1 CtpF protein [Stappia indica]
MKEPAFDDALADGPSLSQLADPVTEPPVDTMALRSIPRIAIQAFCESEAVIGVIEGVGADRRMAKAHVKVHKGGIAAAIEFYRSAPTPNLIMIESRLAPAKLLEGLDDLAEVCDAGTKVIIIGHVNDVPLYRELIHRGISDYLVAPIDLFQVIRTIGDLYTDPDAEPLGRTLAFVGAKGGAGASTVAHNVAWSIGRIYDSDVVLADLDLAFGTAGLDFNQDPLQGVHEAVSSPDRLDETMLDRLLAKCADRLSLLAAPASLERTYDYGETSFDGLVDVMRQGAPSVVLDMPHGWTNWMRKLLTSSDDVILVAEPDLANLRNAKNLADTLRQLRPNDPAPKLVLNRVGVPKRPEIKTAEFAGALGLEAIAIIPFEPQLFGTAANNGQMIGEQDARHATAALFEQIAQAATGRGEARQEKGLALGSLMTRILKRASK